MKGSHISEKETCRRDLIAVKVNIGRYTKLYKVEIWEAAVTASYQLPLYQQNTAKGFSVPVRRCVAIVMRYYPLPI